MEFEDGKETECIPFHFSYKKKYRGKREKRYINKSYTQVFQSIYFICLNFFFRKREKNQERSVNEWLWKSIRFRDERRLWLD